MRHRLETIDALLESKLVFKIKEVGNLPNMQCNVGPIVMSDEIMCRRDARKEGVCDTWRGSCRHVVVWLEIESGALKRRGK